MKVLLFSPEQPPKDLGDTYCVQQAVHRAARSYTVPKTINISLPIKDQLNYSLFTYISTFLQQLK